MNNQLETIQAKITKIRWQSEATGFFVAEAEAIENHNSVTKGDLFVIVGEAALVPVGIKAALTGIWVNHKKYGNQLKVTHISYPDELEAMKGLLSAGFLTGVKEHLAQEIVDKFGYGTFGVIEDAFTSGDTTQLQTIKGIGAVNSQWMMRDWEKEREWVSSALLCSRAGLSLKMSKKAHRYFKADLSDIITNKPYNLTVIHGIGWGIADRIARASWSGKEPIDVNAPMRLAAAIREMVMAGVFEGHTCVPRLEAVEKAMKLAEITVMTPHQFYAKALPMLDSMNIVSFGEYVCDSGMLEKEKAIASTFSTMAKDTEVLSPAWEKVKDELHKYIDLDLTEDQEHAIEVVLGHKISIITGGPGTGKTTLLSALCNILDHAGKEVQLVSPTGKAARRMTQATGFPATTIHKALEIFGEDVEAENTFYGDVVFIDESSMVDTYLMAHVIKGLKRNTRLVLIGDADQLPPVGPGEPFFQAIKAGIPTARLTTIHRQGENSGIVHIAHKIIKGIVPDPNGYTDCYIGTVQDNQVLGYKAIELIKGITEKYGYDMNDLQVLTPVNGHEWGRVALNAVLQGMFNPGGFDIEGINYRPGDKVIHLRNNYELGVMNGETGTVVKTSTYADLQEFRKNHSGEPPLVLVDYDGREVVYTLEDLEDLSLAYAMTIHKSQGSEFKAVVLLLPTTYEGFMLRQLVYTGLTRAKEYCMVLSAANAMYKYVTNEQRVRRYTLLKELLDDQLH